MDHHIHNSEIMAGWYKELNAEKGAAMIVIGSTQDHQVLLKTAPNISPEIVLDILESTARAVRQDIKQKKPKRKYGPNP